MDPGPFTDPRVFGPRVPGYPGTRYLYYTEPPGLGYTYTAVPCVPTAYRAGAESREQSDTPTSAQHATHTRYPYQRKRTYFTMSGEMNQAQGTVASEAAGPAAAPAARSRPLSAKDRADEAEEVGSSSSSYEEEESGDVICATEYFLLQQCGRRFTCISYFARCLSHDLFDASNYLCRIFLVTWRRGERKKCRRKCL